MNQIIDKNKKYIIDYLVLLALSIFTYSTLMANQLVNNFDGVWEGNFHIADTWELSIGRWFWYYLSKLRFGVALDPAISIISLSLFVLGIMFFINLMEVKDRLVIYAAGAAFVCTPLVCIDLSYRYMSPTFATAFLLAVVSMWLSVRVKKLWIAVPVSGLVLSLSLGSYQAYLGVACVIALAYFIKLLMGKESLTECLKKMLAPVLGIVLGGVLYVAFLNLHLRMKDVELSNYMGASEITLKSFIVNFPKSFMGMYQILEFSLKEVLFRFNRLQKFHICLIISAVFVAVLAFYFIKSEKKRIEKAVFVIISLLLMPPAAFAVKFITVEADVSLQMTAGFFMIIPAVLCALPISFEKTKLEKWIAIVTSALVLFFAYGGFYQVQADQSAMYEGKQSVLAITDAIIDKTIDLDYFNPDYSYCFLGSASESRLYNIDLAAYGANRYAVFGAFWGEYGGERSWAGVIHDMKSLNLPIVSYNEYMETVAKEEVWKMPAFPEDGSILLIDDVVVIKVSD